MSKKKILGLFIIAGICTNMFVGNIFAGGSNTAWGVEENAQSVLLAPSYEGSTSFAKEPRGSFLSSGILSIMNVGGGKIGVLSQALMHVPVDKCYLMVNLDIWDEGGMEWIQVESYNFEFTEETNTDQELTIATASFEIEGQPTERYYRLRGMFSAKLGTLSETLSATTEGVMITAKP